MTTFKDEVIKLQNDLAECYQSLADADIGLPTQCNFDNLASTIEKYYLPRVSFTPTLSPVSTTFNLFNSTTDRENIPSSGVYTLNGDSETVYYWVAEADGYVTQTGTITGTTQTLSITLQLEN